MKKVWVKSNQKDIKVKKNGTLKFEIEFKSEPILIGDDIAKELLKNPNFEVVKRKVPDTVTNGYDLNNDGVSDEKDASIAASAMAKHRHNKKGDK